MWQAIVLKYLIDSNTGEVAVHKLPTIPMGPHSSPITNSGSQPGPTPQDSSNKGQG